MADPFSIVTGTLGVLDICLRVTQYLRNVKASAKEIEHSLDLLIEETNSLNNVNDLIKKLWYEHNSGVNGGPGGSQSPVAEHWKAVQKSLKGCETSIGALEKKIGEIVGHDGTVTKNTFDGVKKALRKQSRDQKIQDLRVEIMSHRYSLQMLLQVLTFSYSQSSQAAIGRDLHNLSDEVLAQGFDLRKQIDTLISRTEFMEKEHLKSSVATASEAVSSVRLNKYFYPPRSVNSLYTGREDKLQRLQAAISTAPESSQCRFVICGLGGSGKTEFSCKFAQDNRNGYWAVFGLDGRSEQTIRHSYTTIAKLANLGEQLGDHADVAGKNWLANLELPWLLIIDNADTMSIDDLQRHFPAGERGVILITTRAPDLRILGTTDPGFFDFGREFLNETDSNELLLRAAEEKGRTEQILRAAKKIGRRLGYLPLALIQAGRAILKRVSRCTLENYLDLYDASWNYIRKMITRGDAHAGLSSDGIVNVNVYSCFEISFKGLEHTNTLPAQDAVHLLKLFSFFSNEKIKFSILTTAVLHSRRRREYDAKEAEKKLESEGYSWQWYIRTAYLWYLRQIDKSGPSLPPLLRDENFDTLRIGDALDQLQTLALISCNEEDDSYSVHPLIHRWVREQPGMRSAEQALWCEVASSVLAESILLPPLDTTPTFEELKRHLLPHVRHVQECSETIRKSLTENNKTRRWPGKSQGPIFTRQLAWTYAKFSLILFSNGYLVKAAELQVQVLEFIKGRLGEDNEGAWLIKLFLSQTYAMQTNFNKAGELQEEVFQSSKKVLGKAHVQTLKHMNILGATRAFQARLNESKMLLQTAIEGFEKALGPTADEVYEAKHNLGRTMRRYTDNRATYSLLQEAYKGLTASKRYGPEHERTWEVAEDYGMSMLELKGSDLDLAYKLVLDVKRKRKQKLGTQHPLALLSRSDLARVESARGNHVKGEKIIRKHLPTAEQNLGMNHFGTLMGRTHLAMILGRQKKYEEAERLFERVTDMEHYASSVREDGEHIDRLYALNLLMQMYIEWGKFESALKTCDEIQVGAGNLGGQKLGLEHPIIGRLEATRRSILQRQKADGEVDVVDEPVHETRTDVLLDEKLKKRNTVL